MIKGSTSNSSFQKHQVDDYERKRYSGRDQKLVDKKEQKILRRLLKENKKDRMKILDVPSGYGRFSLLLLEKGASVVSCDLSFHMVKRTTEKLERTGNHFAVVADAKQGLPFKTDIFDGLLCMRFFHHLHHPEERKAVLEEFFRVSSLWVILSYYRMNFFHFIQRILRSRLEKSQANIKMMHGQEFREEIKKTGFDIKKSHPLFRGIHAQHILLLKKVRSLSGSNSSR